MLKWWYTRVLGPEVATLRAMVQLTPRLHCPAASPDVTIELISYMPFPYVGSI